ncbi:WAT1-related protein At2g37460-like [Cucurbita pepo subsp. pepo]|uniref:WAT1-related protein At2g37460-like n=1 Tax=Cucurbita pepo subsp. pepo TaxID=3664 RepID=UPI000C9D99B0|nr:WAT1-related protein At2g37460-like [Cucurbita pepo subsp. pepo]
MNIQVSRWCASAKPFLSVVFLQFGLAGMDILSKAALNQGMSNYVLVVYRHAVATIVIAPFALIFDKKVRPKMTIPVFAKLIVLSLLEPVIDQNLYFLGMKYTTATFAAAMCNILPAITFVMAWILRLEKVKIKSIRSQAKIVGTIATVGGAMIMTLIKGPILELFWVNEKADHQQQQRGDISIQHTIKGSIMITIGCFSWACFMILQAITLKAYPAELSLTAWICLLGTAEGTVLALVMERGNAAVWSITWGTKLLAAVYSGIFCSGLAYYIQGIVMKDKGPVFVTAFSPLSMVIVAIMSSFILGERLYFGRVLGAGVIIVGLYLVVWGKNKDGNGSSEDLKLPTKQTQEIEASNSIDINNDPK